MFPSKWNNLKEILLLSENERIEERCLKKKKKKNPPTNAGYFTIMVVIESRKSDLPGAKEKVSSSSGQENGFKIVFPWNLSLSPQSLN